MVNSTELMVVRDALLHIHRVFYEKVKRGVGDAVSDALNGMDDAPNGVGATTNDVSAVRGVGATTNDVNAPNGVGVTTDTPTETTTSTAEVIREIRSRVLTGRVVYFDGMLQNQVGAQGGREA